MQFPNGDSYQMLNKMSFLLLLVVTNTTFAVDLNTKLYGKFNVSYDYLDVLDNDWVSNASRIGLKGNYPVTDAMEIVYQLEQGVDLMHGGTSKDTLFSTRNSYIGIKGRYGRFVFGTHDTPLKMSQGKIDQFNDTLGDVKDAFVGEVRARDAFMYNSPQLGPGIQFNVMYVESDDYFDSSQSYSVTFASKKLYLAAAFDDDMRRNDRAVSRTLVNDTYRLAGQYSFDNLKLGTVFQSSEVQNVEGGKWQEAMSVSAAYKLESFTLRAQYGDSDIVVEDLQLLSLGVDYHLNKMSKLYINFFQRDVQGNKGDSFEVGAEYKF
jgi:predicted porin